MFKHLGAIALLSGLSLSGQTTAISGNRTIEGGVNAGTDSGTAGAYQVVNPVGARISTYKLGFTETFIATHASANNPTATVDGLTARPIYRNGSTALVAGDIALNSFVSIAWDGTNWQLLTPSANAPTGGSGITQLTNDVTTPANSSGTTAATLSTTGVTAGTYGSSSQAPVITVDAKGRLTNVTTASISGGGGGGGISYGTASNAGTGAASTPGSLYFETDAPATQSPFVVRLTSNGSLVPLLTIGTSGLLSLGSNGTTIDFNPSNTFSGTKTIGGCVIVFNYGVVQSISGC